MRFAPIVPRAIHEQLQAKGFAFLTHSIPDCFNEPRLEEPEKCKSCQRWSDRKTFKNKQLSQTESITRRLSIFHNT
jgi:hypothetical protein